MASDPASAARPSVAGRDRILISFAGRSLAPPDADAIVVRAAGATLYRHLNVGSAAEVRHLTEALQAAARRAGRPPLLIGADHETGQLHAMGDDATPFPGAMALGAVGDESLAERVGAAVGRELRAMGVTLVYAPDCDLATNPRNAVVGIRSFGDDPVAVGRLAAATVRGLQSGGVAATAKHLPGHGDPTGDTHLELPVIERSIAELEARELVPFRAAIEAGVRAVMAGHLAVPALTGRRDVPATVAPAILRDLLRTRLGFTGVTVSDALDMGAIVGEDGPPLDVGAALAAGTDLLLCGPDPERQSVVEAGLARAVARSAIDAADHGAAIARIAALRSWLAGVPTPDPGVVGSAEHRALADEVARRSITRIRDRDGLLPVGLTAGATVLVVEPEPRDLTPADTTSWLRPGGLAAAVRARGVAVEGIVVASDAAEDAGTLDGLALRARNAALVVLGTVDAVRDPAMQAIAGALARSGTPVVAVALRGPWDAVAYPGIGTVLATYGIQPPTLAALAAALVGEAPITGRLPVRLVEDLAH